MGKKDEVVVEDEVVETVDVTDAPDVAVSHALLDVQRTEEPTSDWVDPATVVDTVKLGFAEALAFAE